MKYVLITAIIILAEILYFRIADKYNIIDKPNLRSSHTHITLRGGGIVFPVSMLLYMLFFGVEYLWFMLGLTAVCAVSFIDDIRSVPRYVRLAFQFGSMFLMFYQWGIINVSDWLAIILALVFCTGIINAYNFMDGINGITGGYSLVVLLALLAVNHKAQFIEPSFILVAIIAVLVFCFFNFRKQARCFAGDVGSVGVAFIIIFVLGRLILQTGQLWYIVFLAVYGVDSILTIIHRIILKENITLPHRKHAYQLMANELKLPHITVSLIYMSIQAVISAGAVWLPVNKWLYLGAVVAVLSVAYVVFMKRCYHLHSDYLKTVEKK